jgi:3-keto-5-aminohexanoate cleavage enzyme
MLPATAVWQIIAVGRANLELSAIAVAIGGNARTGLEDTLHLRKGELAPSNAALIRRLANVCETLERPVATVAEAEEAFGLERSVA